MENMLSHVFFCFVTCDDWAKKKRVRNTQTNVFFAY